MSSLSTLRHAGRSCGHGEDGTLPRFATGGVYLVDRAQAAAEQARVGAGQRGDAVSEASAFAAMGFATALGHQFDRAIEHCDEAIRIAGRIDAKPVVANAYVTKEGPPSHSHF